MDYMTELTAIAQEHGGIIETKIAAAHGISKAMLYKLCRENKIHRVVQGQYILPDDMQSTISRQMFLCCRPHSKHSFLPT